ncbi:MAG: ParB/RepB/Spo0J family partition protein [Caldiserica bacterium]|nr:ParB/RepB/Spo0J family partition protein [Caldisericota bacterium]MDH7562112.1 ParB/RepB/Spo0J family partition protein [Caldisericota bacterium]
MTKRGLGKGLGALIPGSELEVGGELLEIPLTSIFPSPLQPREDFGGEALEELVSSVKQHGVVHPVLVRPRGQNYELIAGERRWRAAQLAGLSNIPAIVKELDDLQALEVSLVENIQREDLNPLEVARGLKELMEKFHLTQEEAAEKIGKSRSEVSNLLRLLNLPPPVKNSLKAGKISYGQARALLSLENEEEMVKALRMVEEKKLTVRQTEKMVTAKKEKKAITRDLFAEERERIEADLKVLLGTKVQVKKGKPVGKIVIEYYSYTDLRRIWEIITRRRDVSRET